MELSPLSSDNLEIGQELIYINDGYIKIGKVVGVEDGYLSMQLIKANQMRWKAREVYELFVFPVNGIYAYQRHPNMLRTSLVYDETSDIITIPLKPAP